MASQSVASSVALWVYSKFSVGYCSRQAAIAIGSYTLTRAPIPNKSCAMVSAGASRKSSVSGLKASPSNPIVLPLMIFNSSCNFCTATCRCRLLTSTVARSNCGSQPYSQAISTSALTSLPKHEPPHPTPAFRKRGPMRLSKPKPRTTSRMSAPTRSQRLATSLAKLILVARRALAAYLIILAEAKSVVTTGTAVNPTGRGISSVAAPGLMRGSTRSPPPTTLYTGGVNSVSAIPVTITPSSNTSASHLCTMTTVRICRHTASGANEFIGWSACEDSNRIATSFK